MKLHINWLRDAKYSDNYITDGILFVNKNSTYIPEEYGYRKMNTLWEDHLDEAFTLFPLEQINKTKITRTYAKTKISRYNTNNNYVILNDEYNYLWNSSDTYLYTLQESNDLQYKGLVGIFENNILKAILSPIIVHDRYLNDDNFWRDIDNEIGLGKFVK